MSDIGTRTTLRGRRTNRLHARLAGMGRSATGFLTPPEPRSIGSPERGLQMMKGKVHLEGSLVTAVGSSIWDIAAPDVGFEAALHGFGWLDDLAAAAAPGTPDKARDWTHDWVRRFGDGQGPGWTADLTGQRSLRMINHAAMVLDDAPSDISDRFFGALSRQTRFLARRWRHAAAGLPRFEALTGWLLAGVTLNGLDRHIGPASDALAHECTAQIDTDGAIATRNPEELMEIFALLSWSATALKAAKAPVSTDQAGALTRIAPVLRKLRHSDGGLARCHGGGRGLPGRLDQALVQAGVKTTLTHGLGMGFARLSHGRTTLILDAAAPPPIEASANGHASTLAFELTSGRRPLIVNCGSGRTFGPKWRRAGRATPSHSTLAIDGHSSSRLGAPGFVAGRQVELLTDAPRDVRIEPRHSDIASGLIAGHDGYVATHGLTHVRQAYLDLDGRGVQGEDVLATVGRRDEMTFDKAMDAVGFEGIPFRIRFHLHPDVTAEPVPDSKDVTLTLKSGEVWRFRHGGAAGLSLEPSVYLETGKLQPRATQQIVLQATAMDYATRVSWTLAKARQTPDAVRDVTPDDAFSSI